MTRKILVLPFVLMAAALMFGGAHGAIPLTSFKAMQAKAPEFFVINVQSVKTDRNAAGDVVVRAQALVQKVERTASGVKAGSVIHIVYTLHHRDPEHPLPGPQQLPIIKAGVTCPAYLVKTPGEDAYSPAAEAKSFETLK